MKLKYADVVAVGFDFRSKELRLFASHSGLEKLNLSQAADLLTQDSLPEGPLILVSPKLSRHPICKQLRPLARARGSDLIVAVDDQDAAGWLQDYLPESAAPAPPPPPPAEKKKKTAARKSRPAKQQRPPVLIVDQRNLVYNRADDVWVECIASECRLVELAMAGNDLTDRPTRYGFRSVLDTARLGHTEGSSGGGE